MQLTHLFLLAISVSCIWFGFKISEEVYRIAVVFTGAILLVIAFVLTPSFVQIGLLLLLLGWHRLYTPQKILD